MLEMPSSTQRSPTLPVEQRCHVEVRYEEFHLQFMPVAKNQSEAKTIGP